MSGRLGHIDGARRVGHVPRNGIRKTNYRYGFGGCEFDLDASTGLSNYTDLGLVESFTESIKGLVYTNSNSAQQPRTILADANFNNHPTLSFNTVARNLNVSSGLGMNINAYNTYVFVYKKNANASGATHRSTLMWDNNSNIQSDGSGFALESDSANSVGFYNGRIRTYYSDTPYDTNPHIIVLNSLFYIDNGVSLTPSGTLSNQTVLSNLGGSALSQCSPLFEIAQAMSFDFILTETECLLLSDNINLKYAIY